MFDTIEGILIRASKNPVVKSNMINVTGHNYTYALKFFIRGRVGGFSLKDGGSHGYDDFEEEVGKIVEFFKKD